MESEKDVGVLIHESLKPSLQCAKAAGRANAVLGQLARAVSYRDKVTFLMLFKVYVRPHLEYAVTSWSPWLVGDREVLEKVQRRALGMVSNMRGRTYEDRLVEAGLTTLVDRRVRGDMIETYKIMSGKERLDPRSVLELVGDGAGARTRHAAGVHPLREQSVRPKLDIRRHTFSQRVVGTWNSLPNSLKGVGTVEGFKMGYDEWVSGGRGGAV